MIKITFGIETVIRIKKAIHRKIISINKYEFIFFLKSTQNEITKEIEIVNIKKMIENITK